MTLRVGDQAPDFEAYDQHGRPVRLSDFRGRKVVLYFYPKDGTPGCTQEACSLRDHHEELLRRGLVVIGVSPDGVESHRRFAEKHGLPFLLLSDPEGKIAQQYGVWGERSLYGRTFIGVRRTTFLIDEEGRIAHIFQKVRTSAHAEQILAVLP
ncbi:MAG: thioredoxin-dependent thiol peroxidase [Bacteroidetes bacterium]|nr:thioredoxin-dependent thiol peroxidase [Rhodothermia bacterium]MCS7155553.1 thioredoxin-dependent thiol peroxidase [Bacteroidota bacterium]MCX7906411.1 thioredoxin-dependent thiol peroxidase [Bacteroidota bacterium]MDW8137307.1 thioredoxin-dependent thiol peroxidase [Bacteroidota bacterium]MDW8284823.1 thioredoxin-dependent thiol peroxidase [Bacteroidota bacterium]